MSTKSISEIYGFEKSITAKQLRKIILEEYKKVLKEQEEVEETEVASNPGGYSVVNKMTNIADLDTADAYKQLTSRDENAPLIAAMMGATSWSGKAITGAGGVDGIADWAEGVGEAELKSRIETVSSKLPGSAPAKQDMPALEGDDAAAVQDALSPGGEFNVDLESAWGSGEEDFNTWYDALPDEAKAEFEGGKVPDQATIGGKSKANDQKESKYSLSSVLFEEPFPRFGMTKMPGSKAGASSQADVVGKALAFLTKGMLDGNMKDDQVEVSVGGTLPNSSMEPTQSNILAAKSLLFAFLQGVGKSDLSDMGGAFVTTSNEILDGHHRWSGAYIGTGGGLTHGNVNIVKGDAEKLIPMLVSVGNALGRDQKGVEKSDKNESFRHGTTKDEVIMERWSSLAGLLNS